MKPNSCRTLLELYIGRKIRTQTVDKLVHIATLPTITTLVPPDPKRIFLLFAISAQSSGGGVVSSDPAIVATGDGLHLTDTTPQRFDWFDSFDDVTSPWYAATAGTGIVFYTREVFLIGLLEE